VTAERATHPPATWRSVHGEPAVVEAMQAALTADEVAHAWLLVGPRGVGQQEIVAALAAALNCPESDDPAEGCGTCVSCQRFARGTHSAVQAFEPEGQFHVVSQVRDDWVRSATLTSAEGGRRVFRILQADRMNEAAQNAFLKILEEPPPSVVWVLEAEDETLLLDTIQSRCRRLDLVPWSPDELVVFAGTLDGIAPEDRATLARAAMGFPERLRELADPAMAEARERDLALLDRLAVEGPGRVVPIAKELVGWAKARVGPLAERHEKELADLAEMYETQGRGRSRGWPAGLKQRLEKKHKRLERQEQRRALSIVLDDLASYLRDCLAVRSGAPASTLVNIDHVAALERDAARLDVPALLAGLEAIVRCREALERNGAPELQMERVLMALALPLFRAGAA
jgi:DNA polymerase-3 subunit delta'